MDTSNSFASLSRFVASTVKTLGTLNFPIMSRVVFVYVVTSDMTGNATQNSYLVPECKSFIKVTRAQSALLFTHDWKENSWIHTFPKDISPSCNGYRRWKWTRRHEFKSWMSLIAFHKALRPLGKVWILLFSLQLWVNRLVFFFRLC